MEHHQAVTSHEVAALRIYGHVDAQDHDVHFLTQAFERWGRLERMLDVVLSPMSTEQVEHEDLLPLYPPGDRRLRRHSLVLGRGELVEVVALRMLHLWPLGWRTLRRHEQHVPGACIQNIVTFQQHLQ